MRALNHVRGPHMHLVEQEADKGAKNLGMLGGSGKIESCVSLIRNHQH